MTNQKKIKVVIDRSKWRTGGNGPNKTGEGKTRLRNPSGYKCCLGFLCEAVGERRIMNINTPEYVGVLIPEITMHCPLGSGIINTTLTMQAMKINDSRSLEPSQKEQELKELFKDTCYRLEFVGEYE